MILDSTLHTVGYQARPCGRLAIVPVAVWVTSRQGQCANLENPLRQTLGTRTRSRSNTPDRCSRCEHVAYQDDGRGTRGTECEGTVGEYASTVGRTGKSFCPRLDRREMRRRVGQHVVTVPTLHAVYDLHDVWRMCMRFIPRGGLFRVQDRKHGAVGMVEVHNGTWQQRSGSTAYEFEGGDHASSQTIAWCIRLNVQPTGHDRARLARVQ